MKARFVIFLPVHNGGRYIASTLESIFAQTIRDWRLVVLENGSSDNTLEILRAHARPDVTVLASAPLSIEANWRRVLDHLIEQGMDHELCTIIGHDDLLAPSFLETIDRLANDAPDASLFQTHFDLIDAAGALIRPCKPIPGIESSIDFLAARCWGLRDSYGTGYAFRARDYVRVGGMPALPSLLYADDLLFARLTRIGYKQSAPSTQCSYRLHAGSTSGSRTIGSYAALISALHLYVTTLQAEWKEFDSGGYAPLAALIARDAMIFTLPPARRVLDERARRQVDALARVFESNAQGVPFQRFLGSNFISRDVYAWAKALYLTFVSLKK